MPQSPGSKASDPSPVTTDALFPRISMELVPLEGKHNVPKEWKLPLVPDETTAGVK
jgi:hypothetical protein